MHVLITGHTGFKGSWLTQLLNYQGHEVSGIALDPEPDGLFESARLSNILKHDLRLDIRSAAELRDAVLMVKPDIVYHLAAQPFVRAGYLDPRSTFETNVNGTLNVLEAVAKCSSVKALLVVTTDKVYKNVGKQSGYLESDELGGLDPYSASKSMADLLTQSWIKSFDTTPTAIVRAGNVIGGGDYGKDRLMPHIISSLSQQISPVFRYPDSVRPWQHVLDCLSGYQAIVDSLLLGEHLGEAWNIGPNDSKAVSVRGVYEVASKYWKSELPWVEDDSSKPHEDALLTLDSFKAFKLLNWSEKLTLEESVDWTVTWHKNTIKGQLAGEVCMQQISTFLSKKL